MAREQREAADCTRRDDEQRVLAKVGSEDKREWEAIDERRTESRLILADMPRERIDGEHRSAGWGAVSGSWWATVRLQEARNVNCEREK